MSLADDIKSIALECGFNAVGITGAEPFVEAEQALYRRLPDGHLSMTEYDSSSIRLFTDPSQTLPTAKSIISLAISYLTDDSESSDGGLSGRMSRFSRGLDYHLALNERLIALSEALRATVDGKVEIRSFADTGPLADRAAAIRAGIGAPGKNTCVYVKGYGSWVVLGELLTDLPLPVDRPSPPDICGDCDRCIRACPTGALCAPHTVDVKRCLSYITQSKGFIPHEFRARMGTRIYGCDTCQSACPLNGEATPANLSHFRSSGGLGAHPSLLPLLNVTGAEFRSRIAPTTAGWIRRTRFRRNIAVALGNIGDPSAAGPLATAIEDPQEIIRGHAAWALGRIGTREARSILEQALRREEDPRVLSEIRAALD
jgi:epoxyqueuosine reductase